MTSPEIININESSFDQAVLQSNKLVVVDFWAPWCGPCKLIGPILDNLNREYAGEVVFGKVNVDDEPGLAEKYHVRGIPTLLFFKGGDIVSTKVGLLSAEQLRSIILELTV
ncbi:MAG: thioredoxin [Pseudomonadota bacterium]|nr:thioredoxin [Pseudomonadota bacterium]